MWKANECGEYSSTSFSPQRKLPNVNNARDLVTPKPEERGEGTTKLCAIIQFQNSKEGVSLIIGKMR